MRSGYIVPATAADTFKIAGKNGYNWSLRGSNTRYDDESVPSAYNLAFYTAVLPINGPNNRYNGYPLRCLSTVLGHIEKREKQ